MTKNILLVVLAIGCLYLFIKPKETIKEVVTKEVKEYVNAEVERVNTKVGKLGFKRAVTNERDNIVKDLSGLDDSSAYWKNKFLEEVGINEKNVRLITTYEATIKGLKLSATRTDTSFRYADNWARIEYVKPKDTISNGHFNFSYNAEVNYAEYWKRKNFLSPKQYFIDFWINDPRATINGVKRLKIEPKEDRLGIEVNASSYYTDRLNLGIDGTVRVGRFGLGGGYFYDVSDQKWKPLVSVKYNLLDL